MFEKTRIQEGTIVRNGKKIDTVIVEPVKLNVKNINYNYINGIKIDFQAYIEKKNTDVHVFDELQLGIDKYIIHEVVSYSNFYYIIGEKIKNENQD